MDQTRRETFYILFEEMINTMTTVGYLDKKKLVDIIREICEVLRIAKGTTEFYQTVSHEKAGEGEILSDCDNGRAETVVIHRRIVTRSGAVVIGTLYAASKDVPLSAEEMEKADIVLRALLSFVGRIRLEKAVEKLGFCDENGWPNHRSFMRYLDQVNGEGKLGNYTAVYFNLKHFSVTNQEIGREQGDVVIRNYFNLLTTVVGERGIVCRMGGDNFVMAFEKELQDQILEILSGVPVAYGNNDENRVVVESSAGVYVVPDGYITDRAGEVMDKITATAHNAKQKGTIVFFDEKVVAKKEQTVRIHTLFPDALKKEEFKVYYQPKVDIETGELVGGEALCRWYHEDKLIPPMDFIPILERNSSICQLDFYMLDHVCKDIRKWLDEGKRVVRISVNLSRKHLVDADLLNRIMSIIHENNVPTDYIELELTETTTDVGFRSLRRVVGGLQEEGIYTSVDDFGMGYSSLNLIREIPWNVLKIDKCFLPEADEENVTNLMYKHVVAMVRDMGLECVTEGVETDKQIEILKKNHCKIAQGYFFDKPLTKEDFEDRLDRIYYKLP